ncbi:MAG TPA: hypothetical protein VFV50_16050 [Bdellovibrionales bacterium]|nr:hypothetical protein [Bdellovibrionales bacterium]
MNIETVQQRKEFLLREIEREQSELKLALQDLKVSVSVSEKIRQAPTAWFYGAFLGGFLIGEFT